MDLAQSELLCVGEQSSWSKKKRENGRLICLNICCNLSGGIGGEGGSFAGVPSSGTQKRAKVCKLYWKANLH